MRIYNHIPNQLLRTQPRFETEAWGNLDMAYQL